MVALTSLQKSEPEGRTDRSMLGMSRCWSTDPADTGPVPPLLHPLQLLLLRRRQYAAVVSTRDPALRRAGRPLR